MHERLNTQASSHVLVRHCVCVMCASVLVLCCGGGGDVEGTRQGRGGVVLAIFLIVYPSHWFGLSSSATGLNDYEIPCCYVFIPFFSARWEMESRGSRGGNLL